MRARPQPSLPLSIPEILWRMLLAGLVAAGVAGLGFALYSFVSYRNLKVEDVTVNNTTNIYIVGNNDTLGTCFPASDGDYFTFNSTGVCLEPVDLDATLTNFSVRITALENEVPINYSIPIAVEAARIDALEVDVAQLDGEVNASLTCCAANGAAISILQNSVSQLEVNYSSLSTLPEDVALLESVVLDLEGDIATLMFDVSNLTGRVDGVDEELSDVQAEIVVLQYNVSGLSQAFAEVSNLTERVYTVEAELVEVQSEIAVLQYNMSYVVQALAEISDLQNNASDLYRRVEALESNVTMLSNEVDTLQTDIYGLQNNASLLDDRVTVLENNVSFIADEIGVLQSEIGGLQSNISALSETLSIVFLEIDGIEDRLDSLELNVSELAIEVSQLSLDLVALADQVLALEANLTVIFSDIATLFEQQSVLAANLSMLEVRVTDVEDDVAVLDERVTAVEGNISSLVTVIDDMQTQLDDALYNISSVTPGISLVEDGELGIVKSLEAGEGIQITENAGVVTITNAYPYPYEVLFALFQQTPDVTTYANGLGSNIVPIYYNANAVAGNTLCAAYQNSSFTAPITLEFSVTSTASPPFWPSFVVIDPGGGFVPPSELEIMLPRPGTQMNFTLVVYISASARTMQAGTYIDFWDHTTTNVLPVSTSMQCFFAGFNLLSGMGAGVAINLVENYNPIAAGGINIFTPGASAFISDFRVRGRIP